METRTDQASGASLHSLGQHHQQQHSSSSNATTSSNKGINANSNDLLPSAQNETSISSASSPMVRDNTSSISQEASSSSKGESTELCPSSFAPMTLASIPLLPPSTDLQFTHHSYQLHHQQQPHHIQHQTSANLSVEKDAVASTSTKLQSHVHHYQEQPEVDLVARRGVVRTTLPSVDGFNGSQDSRDPRSRSFHLESVPNGVPDGTGRSSLDSMTNATLPTCSSSLGDDAEISNRPLQPLRVNGTKSSMSSSKQGGVNVEAKDSHIFATSQIQSASVLSVDPRSQSKFSTSQIHGSSSATATKTRRAKQVQVTPGYSLEPSFTVIAPAESLTTIQERRRSSLGDELSTEAFKQKSSKHIIGTDTFQLQPVPACKRRKSSTTKTASIKSSPEKKRRKESTLKIMSSSEGMVSSRIKTAYPSSLRRTYDQHPVPLIKESKGAARHEGNAWITPVAPVQQSKSRIHRPRLSRTQSLPNLKAKPVVDISTPALHRLVMPPRLAEYLSLLRNHAKRQEIGETHCLPQQSPQSDGSYLNTSSIPSGQASQFKSRNGFCSTAVDALGNVKSIFIPSLHPPITRQTLKELDLHEILKNPQLRHDIVFDSNVQFRPNFDGERGKKKKEIGNKYWFAVQREIESGCTCTSFLGKSLLPCACGRGDGSGKEVNNRFTSSLSSAQSPNLVGVANYAHSGSAFGALHSNGKGSLGASTPTTASVSTPMTSFGVRGSRVPSRLPLLIQELRAICLSVLPTPAIGLVASTEMAKTPTNGSRMMPSSMQSVTNQMQQRQSLNSPSSARSASAAFLTPSTCSSAVSTHHLLIAQALDANLITQQIQHGILDIANLMSFLGSILKQHCAPMRDEVIEKMIKTVCEDGNVALGLRMCFEILELMKLDIANHQLRSSRTYLIETAVDFENRWFREQLHHRKMQLDRTTQWYLTMHRQVKALPSSANLSRSEVISASIDAGFMQLIFDPAHSRLSFSQSIGEAKEVVPLPTLILGVTPSSAIHSHPCVNSYPETFQFDAFRLMSFHGDVTDITIVYMLLLLFRQLACSASNLSTEPLITSSNNRLLSNAKIIENASKIATAQSQSVKSEIWTLLHEADLEITAAGGISQSAINLPMPKTPSATGIAARLLNQSAFTSTQKLENTAWRKAMGNVVLQIAARAIQVQIEARSIGAEKVSSEDQVMEKKSPPPSEETIRLLTSWMETNLRIGSRLHLLCQDRIKGVIGAFLSESGGKQNHSVRMMQSEKNADEFIRGKKRSAGEEELPSSPTSKRVKLDVGSTSADSSVTTQAIPQPPSKGNIEVALQRGGLEPFTAEIKLLSERITKVKSFHLRVFQSLYETMALDA